ncbi:MAG: UDP-N-acetylmuramoyl-L-alanine--D-glutamate ligase [Robiginitomaculum sp.]|nr:UDP-N-acetylmuramoyl-L-alanine--D-glutamate ligase [Robiginitomaculum sp.]
MIKIDEFSGKTMAVLGLSRTGLAVAKALINGGASVVAWDDNEAARETAELAGIPIVDLSRRDLADLTALVLSPGIAHTFPTPHHVVSLAKACRVPIWGDVELLGRALNALPASSRPKVIGITGTNGKSTTTALVTHILRSAHLDAHSGGNIGRACLDLPPLRQGQFLVLELSSYQLELSCSLRCDVAALLNLSPDHLERHGGMENYQQAKAMIFANQNPTDLAVIGADDAPSNVILSDVGDGPQQVCAISTSQVLCSGVYVLGAKLMDGRGSQAREIADLAQAPGLRGQHNWQNAAAAFAITSHLGLSDQQIANGLYSFAGLQHRMEPLGKLGPILFVNDSKATNIEAAATALSSYSNIYWIAGGRAKAGGLEALRPYLPNVRKAYLIGEAAKQFDEELKGSCPAKRCGTLEKAFTAAAHDALQSSMPDPVVLLSPACASFDQFTDFEARGDAFRELVDTAVKQLATRPVS